ncbi:MAG: hypothetical protein LBT01_03620 [Spirochaetaceae bacterium]|nr:hypothetical protein [Spirochaetaceae bacterium]
MKNSVCVNSRINTSEAETRIVIDELAAVCQALGIEAEMRGMERSGMSTLERIARP